MCRLPLVAGGGILTHGLQWLSQYIESAASAVSALPVFADIKGAGTVAEQLTVTLLNSAVGIVAGIAPLLLFTLFQKLRGRELKRARFDPVLTGSPCSLTG